LKNWELVDQWFMANPGTGNLAINAFQDGDRTGEVLKQLQHRDFPYNRDALELWRRHQGFQKPVPADDRGSEIFRESLGRVESASLPHTHSLPDEHWIGDLGVRLYVILPDQQIPHHDPHLNELVLRFLAGVLPPPVGPEHGPRPSAEHAGRHQGDQRVPGRLRAGMSE
jgi:hypothetical protein